MEVAGAKDDHHNYIESAGMAFVMEFDGCRFIAWFPLRKDGGFDLFLDRANSQFECLAIDQITWLRHESKGDNILFVASFAGRELDKKLKQEAEEQFGTWLHRNLGMPWTPKTRAEWSAEDEAF